MSSIAVSAQDSPLVDSLRADLASRPADDTLRLYTLRHLWRATRSDPDTAAAYARQQLREATRMNNLLRLAEAHKFLAISLGDRGSSDSIRYHNEIALDYYEQAGDGFQVGITSYNLGIAYQEDGDFATAERLLMRADSAFAGDSLLRQQAAVRVSMAQLARFRSRNAEAIANARRAYELAAAAGDSAYLADAQQEIAFNHQDLGEYPTALEYHRENAAYYLRTEDYYYAVTSLLNIATCLQATEHFEEAEEAARRANALARENSFDQLRIDVLNILGNVYWADERYPEAEASFREALPLFENVAYDRVRAAILVYLAGVQGKRGKFTEARRNGLAGVALSAEQGQLELLHKGYGQLAIVESATGNYELAYNYMVLRQGFQDSLYQQQIAERVAELSLEFDRERQERTIAEQRNRLDLLNSQARVTRLENRLLYFGLGTALVIFGLFAYLLWQRVQARRRERDQLAEEVRGQQRELSARAVQMAQKGQLLDDLAAELRQVKGERPDDRRRLDGLLRNLGSEERIDQDWDNFRNYFQGVHGDFEARLNRRASAKLSPREQRLAALIKMQLNNQEVGSILGVSQDSLYKAKYRLRKKLPAASEGELDDYIRGI